MPHITIVVTEDVITQVEAGQDHQRQLAVRGASDDISNLLDTARRENPIPISICETITLIAGDTDAFWRGHQGNDTQIADFDDLFALLRRRPGASVTFSW
ncbi:MAG: hypothetical protein H8E53_08695 [Planctomycetes bacterium]|nr:hypothetical protein [Planctomycetota bacterium]